MTGVRDDRRPFGPELAAELEHLRARLAEAEEVLRAIRNGEVDGVLVTGDRGEQVYTLRGADRIYRQLIETMSEGAATLSADGVIRYCNGRLAEMLGQPLDRVVGTALRNYLPPADQQALDAILAQARTEPSRREINLKSSEGRLVPIYLSASRLPDEEAEMVFCLVLTDLTEQKSHERIATADRLARSILEQAAEAIVVCDEQGRVMRASQAAERLCDGSPLGRPFAEVFPLRTGTFHLAQVLQGETLRDVDVTLDRQGQELALILNAGPLLSGQQILGCVVTLTDITERRRARDAEARLATILQATPDLVGIADPQGRLVYVNRAGRKMLGIDELADLTGYNIREFHDAASAHVVLTEGIPTAMREGAWTGETQLVALDGHAIVTSQVILAHKAPNGTLKFVSTIARDITERKRVEGTHRLQSAALNAAADAMIITGRDGAIAWINAAFTGLTGYNAEEAIGRNPRELVKSGVHDGAFYKAMWDTILAGDVWRGEVTNRRKDGSLYPEAQTITPVKDDRGEIAHFIAIKRDLTEERHLEARFLQAQKMESVGQLAGGIAHDFNNLLTVINGMAEFVLSEVGEDAPVHADVQEILHAGQRAAALTRQLLAFSRQQVMEPRVLNFNTVVAETESLLRRLLGEDINLVVVPTSGVGDVKADSGQIGQVITNLAVNARDAMPRGGRLTIETQNVTIDEDYAREHGVTVSPGPYVLLSVTDSGVGMDEATRARVFEPFFTTKGPGKGTGLGLSTVYGIVKQSHGFIWAYSEVGQGTSFKIYLPRVAEAASTDQPEPTVVSSSGTETVLLVEDNAGLRKLATRLLEPAGYTVLEAASGEDALRVLEHHGEPVHLLLSDVVLPGMSGRELAEQLVQTHQGMKVLYMSGYTSDTIVRHGVLEATVAFLNKPFTAAALLRKVREVLDSQG